MSRASNYGERSNAWVLSRGFKPRRDSTLGRLSHADIRKGQLHAQSQRENRSAKKRQTHTMEPGHWSWVICRRTQILTPFRRSVNRCIYAMTKTPHTWQISSKCLQRTLINYLKWLIWFFTWQFFLMSRSKMAYTRETNSSFGKTQNLHEFYFNSWFVLHITHAQGKRISLMCFF